MKLQAPRETLLNPLQAVIGAIEKRHTLPILAHVLIERSGSRLTLANGKAITVDEAYLRQAILNPSQHVIQGYAPIMPTYQGEVSEEGVIALVEFIKQLDSNYRIQQTLNTTDLPPENEGQQAPAAQGKVKP